MDNMNVYSTFNVGINVSNMDSRMDFDIIFKQVNILVQ